MKPEKQKNIHQSEIEQVAQEITDASKNQDYAKGGSFLDYVPSAGKLITLGTAASIAALMYGAGRALENAGKELESNAYKGLDLSPVIDAFTTQNNLPNIGAEIASFDATESHRTLRGSAKDMSQTTQDSDSNIYDSQKSWSDQEGKTLDFSQQNYYENSVKVTEVKEEDYLRMLSNSTVTGQPSGYPSEQPTPAPAPTKTNPHTRRPTLAPTVYTDQPTSWPSYPDNLPEPPDNLPEPKKNNDDNDKEKLSGAEIAGIAVGSLAGVVCIIGAVAACIADRTPSQSPEQPERPNELGFRTL